MKKSEIETYMDAYMEGFWACYCTMLDLIDDEPETDSKSDPSEIQVRSNPKAEAKPKPKPNAQKIDRGKVCALLDAGWSAKKIAGEMKVSEASIYNIQKEYREAKAKQEEQA